MIIAHDKWTEGPGDDASSVARQLAASPMMLFARRLESALIQKRLHGGECCGRNAFPPAG